MTDAILKLLRLYINLPEDEKLNFLKELRQLEAIKIEVRKDYEWILKSPLNNSKLPLIHRFCAKPK